MAQPAQDNDETKAPSPRRYERVSVQCEVSMCRLSRPNFRVHIYDLSPDGCKVEFVERPELGELLWIRFDGLESIEASVRWIAGARAGVRFTHPIHPAVFDRLAAQLA